jgi:MOSC domain-containing protein YiiM
MFAKDACCHRSAQQPLGVAAAGAALALLVPKCPLCLAAYLSFLGAAAGAVGWLRPLGMALLLAGLAVAVWRYLAPMRPLRVLETRVKRRPMTDRPEAGLVENIHIAAGEGEPMRPLERVRLIAGLGLEGDRYTAGRGHFSGTPGTGRALTLIEAEVLDSLRESLGIILLPADTRRNVTTRRIRLNDLVGRRFRIGNVLCEGRRLCEPCEYLESLAKKPLLHPLVNRGGLRADVLETGEIRLGDPVQPLEPE